MAPPKKRKAAKASVTTKEQSPADVASEEVEISRPEAPIQTESQPASCEEPVQPSNAPAESEAPKTVDPKTKALEMRERFKALQAQAKKSTESNLKAAAVENQKLGMDPNALNSINRKRAEASHKLLKEETAAAGEDFERKRAWDWTVEEAEKWDKRMGKKERHRGNQEFRDYRQEARKTYKRQMRELAPDMEAYQKEKMDAIQKAAQSGELEIFETEDGELVAVDKQGTFYSTSDSTGFVDNKPDKANVDRLVNDLRKAEETRIKKREDRLRQDGEADVTYINDKNKQFNLKLARFYNKYTAEIRESFERGTMI
jgi:pre-mRNA-splicing factor SYF2